MLEFGETVLHHVADRDHAVEPSVEHDRHMAELAGSHDLHHLIDRGRRDAGNDPPGHVVGNLVLERRRAALGHGLDDIAFGENAVDTAARIGHDHRADPVLEEHPRRLLQALRCARRHDSLTLARENFANAHGPLLF